MNFYTGIGARRTPPPIQVTMRKIAAFLAAREYILRSGGAVGADAAFEEGCNSVSSDYKEIYLASPRPDMFASTTYINPRCYGIAESVHPRWSSLSEYSKSLHARNVHQILGADLNSPSSFVLCWTRGGKATGGTGVSIRIAESYGIPVWNFGNLEAREIIARVQQAIMPA